MKETMYGQEIEGLKHVTRAEIEAAVTKAEAKASEEQRASLMVENRMLKTLVQEGRATPAQEARLTQVRNELADMAEAKS